MLILNKVDFVEFIAHVINNTSQTNKKSKELAIPVSAAERFLGLQDFTPKTFQGILSEDTLPSQAPEHVVIGVDI